MFLSGWNNSRVSIGSSLVQSLSMENVYFSSQNNESVAISGNISCFWSISFCIRSYAVMLSTSLFSTGIGVRWLQRPIQCDDAFRFDTVQRILCHNHFRLLASKSNHSINQYTCVGLPREHLYEPRCSPSILDMRFHQKVSRLYHLLSKLIKCRFIVMRFTFAPCLPKS